MKFYNNTVAIDAINFPYSIVNSNDSSLKAAIIITIQIINNNSQVVDITFKRKNNSNGLFTNYVSTFKVKTGSTILDHLMVIQNGYQYTVQSSKNNIIVSCSYGI